MKKLITSIIIVLTSLNVFSTDGLNTEVVLYSYGRPITDKPTVKPHSVVNYPHVINENGTIVITSSRLIENAYIIITDSNGTTVANKVASLSPTAIRIQIPDADEGEMYKIEIEYGDTYLYGFIN